MRKTHELELWGAWWNVQPLINKFERLYLYSRKYKFLNKIILYKKKLKKKKSFLEADEL